MVKIGDTAALAERFRLIVGGVSNPADDVIVQQYATKKADQIKSLRRIADRSAKCWSLPL